MGASYKHTLKSDHGFRCLDTEYIVGKKRVLRAKKKEFWGMPWFIGRSREAGKRMWGYKRLEEKEEMDKVIGC